MSDLGFKKYGGIWRQIHKVNKYIRYFVLCLCKKIPHHSGKCGGFLEKMESPMSGHLGINKTYHKIINHFYWPGLRSDVSKYCKTCHTCQMVGKPNQTIPRAQLQPIPAFDEPFSRILIDCVGPLPRTKSGNEYLLTIMCTSTCFPEAIP